MGLIGMYFLAKSINNATAGSGGHYYSHYDYEQRLAEEAKTEAKKLGYVRDAMGAVDGYEITDGAEVPARVYKGVQRLFISKKRNIKHRSIVVLKADPNGVQMPETGVDFSRYSAVGVIDSKTLCLYEKDSGDLLMLDIAANFDCGPHGDYNATSYPMLDGEGHLRDSGYDLRSVDVSFTRVKADGTVEHNANAPEEFSHFKHSGTYRDCNVEPIKFGIVVRDAVSAFRERQAESENAHEKE